MRLQGLFVICIVASAVGPMSAVRGPSQDDVAQHADRARQALARNDLNTAEQEYRSILQLNPNNADVRTALGVVLYGSGNLPQAVRELEKALQIDKSQTRAELFLGLSKSDIGECDKALPILDRHFSNESDAKLRRLVGLSLLDCQMLGSDARPALLTVQKLRELYPDDADVLYKSVELYTSLWNEAAGKLLQDHPESYRVHELAGEVYEAQGHADRALKEFRAALQQNPRIPGLHFRIGQILLTQDTAETTQDALNEFQKELGVDPRSAAAENAIGDIYRARPDTDEAIRHYRRSMQLDPDFAQAHIGLAQVSLARHAAKDAQRELEIAARLQPENASAHYHLMIAYRSEGKMAEASREMSLFQKLQQQSSQTFEDRLHSLITAQSAAKR